MDITNSLVSFDGTDGQTPPAQGADAASAAPASLGGDTITTTPLAHFGSVVQQIGKSMASDPASDPTAHAQSMNDAIDLLESVVGMMSLYGSPDQMAQRLQSGDLPKLESL